MYFGQHAKYKNKVQEYLGGYQLKEPDVNFYTWFYQYIRPCNPSEYGPNSLSYRYDLRYAYDIQKLFHKSIKITGALSSLCDARGFHSSDAWRFYYVIYEHRFIHNNLGIYLPDYEPPDCRFSLRIAKVDPAFFEFHGIYVSSKCGCFRCSYLPSGCVSCIRNSKLTYKQAARKNLRSRLIYHSKCRGSGCSICYNKTRQLIYHRNNQRGVGTQNNSPCFDRYYFE